MIQIVEQLPDPYLLALTGLAEAGGEPLEGLIAVMQVVRHRVRDPRWPNTWRGVILQPKQFSCWNLDDGQRPKLEKWAEKVMTNQPVLGFPEALWVANGVIHGAVRDLVKGSCHYHTLSSRPKWSRHIAPTLKIGNHVFFNNIK